MKYSKAAFQEGTFQEGWQVWEGIEQEGPYKGYSTVFIGSICLSDTFLTLDISSYQQLYINPGFSIRNVQLIKDKVVDFEGVVTIVAQYENYKFLREVFFDLPSIIFMVIFPEIPLLREKDIIRFDLGSMKTYSVKVKDMTKTDKQSYLADRRIR